MEAQASIHFITDTCVSTCLASCVVPTLNDSPPFREPVVGGRQNAGTDYAGRRNQRTRDRGRAEFSIGVAKKPMVQSASIRLSVGCEAPIDINYNNNVLTVNLYGNNCISCTELRL